MKFSFRSVTSHPSQEATVGFLGDDCEDCKIKHLMEKSADEVGSFLFEESRDKYLAIIIKYCII